MTFQTYRAKFRRKQIILKTTLNLIIYEIFLNSVWFNTINALFLMDQDPNILVLTRDKIPGNWRSKEKVDQTSSKVRLVKTFVLKLILTYFGMICWYVQIKKPLRKLHNQKLNISNIQKFNRREIKILDVSCEDLEKFDFLNKTASEILIASS